MNTPVFPETPILLVDDEEDILQSYRMTLRYHKINNITLCSDSREVMTLLGTNAFSAVVLDLTMPHITGQQILSEIQEQYPGIPVIVITGSDKVTTAVECMKLGALDYMVKPVEESRFVSGIRNALEIGDLQRENRRLKRQVLSGTLRHPEAFSSIVTVCETMKSIFRYIEAIAASPRPVLITGESGTGKELVARAVHDTSGRPGEFVAVNVAGLDDNIFSDTLFGHKKGAFTGADTPRQGLVEKAAGGTLFLDEIGSLEKSSQVKLLRLLQEKEYYPLGSDVKKTTDVVVIAATNDDLQGKMASGEFRTDLFFRLKTHHIRIPPLRERPEDLPFLIDHFVEEAAKSLNRPTPAVSSRAVTLLSAYTFPGNVRELQAIIFDAVGRTSEKTLSVESLEELAGADNSRAATQSGGGLSLGNDFPKLKEVEDFLISEAMKRANGNQSIAAQLLGVAQSTLSRRFKTRVI